VDVNTLSVIDLLDAGILDTSSTNIAGSASSPTQVVASTAAATKKMQILDTTGAFIGLYTGPLASEVLQLVIGPGSDQTIEHAIPASTRISLKRLDSTTAISSGIVAINFIG
jgi:cellobiose-specific phosphotransferase system component IIC